MTDEPLEPRLEDEEAQQAVVRKRYADARRAGARRPRRLRGVRDDAYLRLAAEFDNYRKRVAARPGRARLAARTSGS